MKKKITFVKTHHEKGFGTAKKVNLQKLKMVPCKANYGWKDTIIEFYENFYCFSFMKINIYIYIYIYIYAYILFALVSKTTIYIYIYIFISDKEKQKSYRKAYDTKICS